MALIKDLTSPFYNRYKRDWTLYRDVLESGAAFRDKYLKKYSVRETDTEFQTRRDMSYTPAVARACLVKFKNAIFQRMADITRTGGENAYQTAVQGSDMWGIDGDGRSMNQFIGQEVILELLAMRQVGIFVDRAELPEKSSKAEQLKSRPYSYMYVAEDILNFEKEGNVLSKILLRRNDHKVDDHFGLYIDDTIEYVYMEKTDFGIIFQTYADCSNPEEGTSEPIEDIVLDLPEIPFVLLEIEQSLLKDIARYQIALLNIESGDVNFCWKANFPFYTEQQDLATGNMSKMNVAFDENGKATDAVTNEAPSVKVSTSSGRLYGAGMERPDFIHPSPEPLLASIAKQDQMKDAIEYLIGLNLSTLASSSAENKESDSSLKEEGLSVIGLELERAERKIAEIWSYYMGTEFAAQVDYPNNYSLRTDEDRRKEASEIIVEAKKIPSVTFQKEAAKRAAQLILTQGISQEQWTKIYKDIDSAVLVFVDPDDVRKDKEAGLVSSVTASEQIRMYPKGEGEKARAEKVAQLREIAIAQSSNDNDSDSTINMEARVGGGEEAEDEKEISQLNDGSGKKVRGEEQ